MELLISRASLASDAVIGVLLPMSKNVRAKGLKADRLPLTDDQRKPAEYFKLDTSAAWVIGQQSECEAPPADTPRTNLAHRLRVPARQARTPPLRPLVGAGETGRPHHRGEHLHYSGAAGKSAGVTGLARGNHPRASGRD